MSTTYNRFCPGAESYFLLYGAPFDERQNGDEYGQLGRDETNDTFYDA